MKTLRSLAHDAMVRLQFWEEVMNDPQALADRKMTQVQACGEMKYQQGCLAALNETLAEGIVEDAEIIQQEVAQDGESD